MNPDNVQHKRGRKPSGRVTVPVNIRLEISLRDDLKRAATKKRPQTMIMEEALKEKLHPTGEELLG